MNRAKVDLINREYQWGFTTDLDTEQAPKGLNESIIQFISAKKNEPSWVLDYRLKAFRHWQTLAEPSWSAVQYEPINYQNLCYYSAPKQKTQSPKV